MDRYARSHLANDTLLRSAETNAGRERTSMADLLADIAEIDARRLYVPAGYPSVFAYCVGELRLSEDSAGKRITAARTARRFPVIFGALAEGRLKLSGVCLLAARLTEDTAAELITAALDQSKAQIERLLAARFPQSDLLPWVETPNTVATPSAGEHAPGHVQVPAAPGPAQAQPGPGHAHPRVKPLSSQSCGVQFTLSQSEHDLVRHAQELLPADVKEVFMRALREHVRKLEKGKFAATERPRSACPRPTRSARHIPAHVRRAVWQRDGGQCTFVSDSGHRCEARRHIQFDHIDPVARGGEATVSGIRLLCRAHNQHAAERTFGAEFMRHKRLAAAEAREVAQERAAGRAAVQERETRAAAQERETRAAAQEHEAREVAQRRAAADARAREKALDAAACLRRLGFRAEEIRRAAELWGEPNTPLEEMMRSALKLLCPKTRYGRSRAD